MEHIEGSLDLRDRASLLLAFAAAFRLSQLVALDVVDIEETQTGLLARIRCGKTDVEARPTRRPDRPGGHGSHDCDHAR
jgi:site-specific recombinase XerC